MFVPEDAMQDTVKAYFKFEEDLFTEAKKVCEHRMATAHREQHNPESTVQQGTGPSFEPLA